MNLKLQGRWVTGATIKQEARASGDDVTYLRFQPAELEDDAVGLTLEVSIAPGEPSLHATGSSEIKARFRQVEDRWEIVDEPRFFVT